MDTSKIFFLLIVLCVCLLSISVATGGIIGLLNANKSKKKPVLPDESPQQVDPNNPNATPTEGAVKPEQTDPIRELSIEYKQHFQPDLIQRPEFSIPVGLVSGFILDPDFLIYALSRVSKAIFTSKIIVNQVTAPTATHRLANATGDIAVQAGEKAAKEGAQEAIETTVQKGVQKVASQASMGAAGISQALQAARVARGLSVLKGVGSIVLGANPVTALYGAIDIAGLILDLVDPLGYNKVFFNHTLNETRKVIAAEWMTFQASTGLSNPTLASPLDKLSKSKLETDMTRLFQETNEDPENFRDVFALFKTQKFGGGDRFEDLGQLYPFLNRYMMTRPMNAIYKEAMMRLCLHNDGKLVKFSDSHPFECTYKTKAACESSFSWPKLKEGDIYSEWNEQLQVCQIAPMNAGIRSTCETDWFGLKHVPKQDPVTGQTIGLAYNKDRRNCEIDEPYCSAAGITFRKDKFPYGPDCELEKWQAMLELFTSQYLVRAFR